MNIQEYYEQATRYVNLHQNKACCSILKNKQRERLPRKRRITSFHILRCRELILRCSELTRRKMVTRADDLTRKFYASNNIMKDQHMLHD